MPAPTPPVVRCDLGSARVPPGHHARSRQAKKQAALALESRAFTAFRSAWILAGKTWGGHWSCEEHQCWEGHDFRRAVIRGRKVRFSHRGWSFRTISRIVSVEPTLDTSATPVALSLSCCPVKTAKGKGAHRALSSGTTAPVRGRLRCRGRDPIAGRQNRSCGWECRRNPA